MSTSDKIDATIRQGGPGSSQQNAKEPLNPKKGEPDSGNTSDGKHGSHAKSSGGGGEHDKHHGHSAESKSTSHKAHQ